MDAVCVLFLLYSQPRLSIVSVEFDFNASLIDVAPASPMLLSVDLMKKEKSGLLMYTICMFLLCSQLRSNFVIVVFVFNASLNDFAPVSSIQLSVYLLITEKRVDC